MKGMKTAYKLINRTINKRLAQGKVIVATHKTDRDKKKGIEGKLL